MAEVALTILHGASQMAAAAPGFVDPFNIVSACEQLADLDLDDRWSRQPSPCPRARPADEPWAPPPAVDVIRGEPARLAGDGVVAVLGLHRLGRRRRPYGPRASRPTVTVVLVTGDPGELAPLARLVIAELRGLLRQAFPAAALAGLQVVLRRVRPPRRRRRACPPSATAPRRPSGSGGPDRGQGRRPGACHAAAAFGG